ncbi:MAG: hypothetical protein FWE08_06940 [Oscillospiraceae bacterium]|nr:hypothetical protein [Oscillospiraceae bacterium]
MGLIKKIKPFPTDGIFHIWAVGSVILGVMLAFVSAWVELGFTFAYILHVLPDTFRHFMSVSVRDYLWVLLMLLLTWTVVIVFLGQVVFQFARLFRHLIYKKNNKEEKGEI